MRRGNLWTIRSQYYVGAGATGGVCGAVAFTIRSLARNGSRDTLTDLQEMAAWSLAGALLGLGIAVFKSRAARRASERHEQLRKIRIVHDGGDHPAD